MKGTLDIPVRENKYCEFGVWVVTIVTIEILTFI